MAYPPPPGGQGYYPYPQARPTNGLAIAALVCGIAQFFVGVTFIPAIICGHMARRQIRRTGEAGDGMALAGIILGYIGVVLFIGVVVLALFFFAWENSQMSTVNLEPRRCSSLVGARRKAATGIARARVGSLPG